MGACLSAQATFILAPKHLLEASDGGKDAFQHRFQDQHDVLGHGEFGVVKLVRGIASSQAADDIKTDSETEEENDEKEKELPEKKQQQQQLLACKVLHKGAVFKDNTLLFPTAQHVLKGEVEMLRALENCSYCLQMVAIYETPRLLLMVTEYCSGGEMQDYIAARQKDEPLTSQDFSRMAFQLLTAVNHCANKGIIHRDIKPQNILFKSKDPKAPLRLIDFGSGCISSVPNPKKKDLGPKAFKLHDGTEAERHTTFAGSAFYMSPEMYDESYTQRTDIWSVGVVLYVLVAGYPAEKFQKAFNIFHKSKDRDLRTLPNLPTADVLPDSYFELLEACLTYRHRSRPSANKLLQFEFVRQPDNETIDDTQQDKGKLDHDQGHLSLEEVVTAAASAAMAPDSEKRQTSLGSLSIQESDAVQTKDQERTMCLGPTAAQCRTPKFDFVFSSKTPKRSQEVAVVNNDLDHLISIVTQKMLYGWCG